MLNTESLGTARAEAETIVKAGAEAMEAIDVALEQVRQGRVGPSNRPDLLVALRCSRDRLIGAMVAAATAIAQVEGALDDLRFVLGPDDD